MEQVMLRHWMNLGVAALALIVVAGVAQAQTKTRIVVYSTLEPEHIDTYRKAFEADNPDIEMALVNDSTGVLTARLLAEKDRPQGDALWGLAVTSIVLLDAENVLLPYAPKELAGIKPNFRDPNNPPHWVGIDAWVGALCFNTIEAKKRNLPRPASWTDLLDPVYRGQLTMPHPASSGTGYFHVSAWLQLFGEEEGWKFMDRLHENIAMYVHSGAKPCRMAGAGEFAIGISADISAANARRQGAPIDPVVLKEGGGWDMDTAAILRGTKNLAAAQRLMDWAASRKANELYAKWLPLVAAQGVSGSLENYPPNIEQSMIKNDFTWASSNRARILAEWQRRYNAKAEPK
jgi:iron(III) transport system substrate-binding protein